MKTKKNKEVNASIDICSCRNSRSEVMEQIENFDFYAKFCSVFKFRSEKPCRI